MTWPVITKLGGWLGAQVDGVNLAEPLDATAVDLIRAAFATHSVLIFPGQGHLTPADQVTLAEYFGEVVQAPLGVPTVDGNGLVLNIHTGEGAPPHTDEWHSDVSFVERPPMASVLLARKLPPAGGDTIWASCYRALDTLSETLRDVLSGLCAVHWGGPYAKDLGQDPAAAPSAVHPVVRLVEPPGRSALFVNAKFTSHFEGMTRSESAPLLDYLFQHTSQPNLTFRHRWTVGDLAIWDNRCVVHYAVWDYREERIMHRVTVRGERPVAPPASTGRAEVSD